MKNYIVKTLGCKANFYDSQQIEAELQKRGWAPWLASAEPPGADTTGTLLCVVNSCTVTDEADRQTRKMAARLFRDHPGATVVVTGCGAEVDPERLANSKGIHYVIGNRDKPKLVELILRKLEEGSGQLSTVQAELEGSAERILGVAQGYGEMLSRHPIDREWPGGPEAFSTPPVQLDGHSDKTRAFLKIQEGCNSFCTYCVIPYGRGPSRSIRPREILTQIRELVTQGVREVVITGTNIGDYGTDWGDAPALDELLELIFAETGLERLRVSSLDPTEVTPRIFALMEREPRFCRHFHVSLQSPDTRILRLMKRRYGFEQVRACLERIAGLGAFVGMDVITGFPGESSEDFERGVEALAGLPWSRLHVFPYSERQGTPATRLPGSVPREERLARARRLNELSLERLVSHHERVLEECRARPRRLEGVLLEKPFEAGGRQWIAGYTPDYLRVILPWKDGLNRNDCITVIPKELQVDPANFDVSFLAE